MTKTIKNTPNIDNAVDRNVKGLPEALLEKCLTQQAKVEMQKERARHRRRLKAILAADWEGVEVGDEVEL